MSVRLTSSRLWASSGPAFCLTARYMHGSRPCNAIKPFLLADVGEGITECQIIQWFVQPGARVEEFDKICEVQSDKASVEITSPFAGVIKKLHYHADDMAITGKPLLDIDAEDDDSEGAAAQGESSAAEEFALADRVSSEQERVQSAKAAGLKPLATPAVRHLVKLRNVDIRQVNGTGRDGRVLKQDVLNHTRNGLGLAVGSQGTQSQQEGVPLTAVQNQMFKLMTKSLTIPHFLYSCSADMTAITDIRQRTDSKIKITAFSFILKAVSIALGDHRLLNVSLDCTNSDKPTLTFQPSHNFGIAIDTPAGLLVPVIKNVQDLSIEDIARKVADVSTRARDNKLLPTDFTGATFTLSNIGAIGGGVVSPVISAPQVAILGIGRSKLVPAFDQAGNLCKREELVLSWSADHRVVDGAECARAAEKVRSLLENPASMMMAMRY